MRPGPGREPGAPRGRRRERPGRAAARGRRDRPGTAAQVGEALLDRPGGVVTRLAWESYLTPPEPLNFSAAWARKDLAYAARLADGAGQSHHPLLDGVLSLFAEALAEGRGEEDWSTVNPTAPH
ncbi:hypothetical protein AB0953_31410 [Streptomyces sp. NPDC046866]|uniref:hypothetical protein n=1 Tax=Streptomyces sp. NPDC046866 TaxID=3154921 RepID=UPI003451B7D6